MNLVRAGTVGTHPRFVRMIRELVEERMTPGAERPALGNLGPSHDVCPIDCCLAAAHARRNGQSVSRDIQGATGGLPARCDHGHWRTSRQWHSELVSVRRG